ncbi:MAG: hypothetical protein WBO70_00390 [Erysipelotrichaceae bacterium]
MIKYDTKLEFEFDEEKVLKEGDYTVEELYTLLDEIMVSKKINKTGKGTYEGDWETEGEKFLGLAFILLHYNWIKKYVSKWVFTNPEEGVNDCLHIIKRHCLNLWVEKK